MKKTINNRRALKQVFDRLHGHYGPLHWWPGETPFEIMVGAVLTQNTAWTNVERAIANLVAADALDAQIIVDLPHERLGELIRPSGYFNVKARRLKAFCEWYLANGQYERLKYWSTPRLRDSVLAVNGVGPETADDIVLYAFKRPVFVIDAYTRRMFSRLGLIPDGLDYEALRGLFESRLPASARLYNEYHALIVIHSKDVCRKQPDCAACVLARRCPAAGQ